MGHLAGDFQFYVDARVLIGSEFDLLLAVLRKASHLHFEHVDAREKIVDLVITLFVGNELPLLIRFCVYNCDSRAGYNGRRCIGHGTDDSTENALSGRR